MPPSIWARTMSGLTAIPQSTAQTTRSTLGRPSASQRHLRDLRDHAAERLVHGHAARAARRQRLAPAGLAGREVEHAQMARVLAASARRSSTGSRPVACASSSRNVSVENAVCELPTERHQSTGTPTSVVCSSTARFGNGIGQVGRALDRGRVDAVLDRQPLERRARRRSTGRRCDAPRPRCRPRASSPARSRCT